MDISVIKNDKKIRRYTFLQLLNGLEGIIVIITCYLTFFFKPLRDRWGLSKTEVDIPLPVDEVVAKPKSQYSHAVIINAPVNCVWPWIAQIGQGRGGFYSYEVLENITGLNISNSEEILLDYQHPKVGDLIPFGPKDAYPLIYCNYNQGMAIENWYDLDAKKVYDPKLYSPKNYLHLTWLWYVESQGANCSRFISRNRIDYSSSFKSKLMFGFLTEPVIFAMDRKMCLGIKKRAEQLYEKKA